MVRVGCPVRLRRSLLAALAALAAGACAGRLTSSGPSAAEVEDLRRQVVEQKRRATVSEVESARLQREIARLRAELEAGEQTALQLPPALEPEPLAPGDREPIEETDLEEEPVAARPVAARPVAARPVAARPVAARPVDAPPADAPPEPEAPPRRPTEAAQTLYDEGYTLFHQGRYAEAEARFRRYLELYPQSELADNALFWVGECRFARGDLSSALDAFTATVERYPRGNKVDDALFKAGKCLEALGNLEQARSTYEEILRSYPGSAAAAQARERLDALR